MLADKYKSMFKDIKFPAKVMFKSKFGVECLSDTSPSFKVLGKMKYKDVVAIDSIVGRVFSLDGETVYVMRDQIMFI